MHSKIHKARFWLTPIFTFFLMFVISLSVAETVQEVAWEDTYCDSMLPNDNFGENETLVVSHDSSKGSYSTAQIVFPLGSYPGKTLKKATLSLTYFSPSSSCNAIISKIGTFWREAYLTWNTHLWIYSEDEVAVTFLANKSAASITADVTAAVLSWINGTIDNRGFFIRTEGNSFAIISSKDSSVVNWRPKLTLEFYDPPDEPTGVSASDGSSSLYLDVEWSSVSGADEYMVYRATSSGGSKSEVSAWQSGTSIRESTISGGAKVRGMKYYYWVKARNAYGESEYSSYDVGHFKLYSPINVSATDDTYTDKVRISWDGVTDATDYQVFRADTSGGSKTAVSQWQSGTSFDDTTAVAGTTYYYWVKARRDFESDYSSYDFGRRKAVVETVATPTIFPNGGSYQNSVQVTLDCTTAGATIHYTTNESAPTSSSTAYSSPFTLNSTATVKAKAFLSGYNDSGVTSANFTVTTTPGELNFEHTEYTVNEGSGTVTLNVLRQNGSSGAISVDCATLNVAVPNAATAGSDYVSRSVKLNWADGDSSAKSVTISIINDSAVEGDEIFGVGLSNPTGGATTGISLAGVTITDNDVSQTYPVTYNANGATGTAPASQTKTNNVTLTLASNSGNLAKIGYTFSGWNTAANGSGTNYAAGGSYTANASVTLYAKWTVSLDLALDATGYSWTTGGNAAWSGQSSVTHDGTDAAQSGVIGNSQSSWFETTMTGPGTLSFWWKVSSESGYDYLKLLIDGVVQDGGISGEVDWQQKSCTLVEGTHTVRWEYSKDGLVASGSDRAWVDQVSFSASGPNDYLVLLYPQGGSGMTYVIATLGQPMPPASAPTLDGYTFTGYWDWYYAPGIGGVQYYTATMTSARNWDKTANDQLYARWVPSTYALVVNNGTGGGPYASGDRVAITAAVPTGKRFYRWLGSTQYVDSVTSASTYVTMPAFSITLTATNKPIAMPWLNLLLE